MRGLGLGSGLVLAAVPGHGLPPAATIDLSTGVFFTGATLTNLTGAENNAADDFGVLVAEAFLETAVTGTHAVSPAAIFSGCTNTVTYTVDVVVKPNGRTCCLVQVSGVTNNAYVCVDLLAKTSGLQNQVVSWSVTDMANGFKQVRLKFTSLANEAVGVTVFDATSNSVYTGIVGDTAKGLILARATISH